MKNKIFLAAIVLTTIYSYNANAQVSVQFNINAQPAWGPGGYDVAQYYYIPDIDAYYDVAARDYVYMDNGNWVTTSCLPERYSNFDLYNAHKVVINESRPWMHYDRDRNQYNGYRGRHDQVAIRDYRDQRYYQQQRNTDGNRYEQRQHQDWNGNRAVREQNSNNAYGARRRNEEGRGRHGWN